MKTVRRLVRGKMREWFTDSTGIIHLTPPADSGDLQADLDNLVSREAQTAILRASKKPTEPK
jgi:hypothetical protein